MKSDPSTQIEAEAGPDEPIHVAARLEHIFVSPGHDYWVKRPEGVAAHGIRDLSHVRCVEDRGLEGDRYFHGKPGGAGQVSFIEAEAIEAIRSRFGIPDLDAAVFRRNLVVRGMRLRELVGERFVFQGITFAGAQECKPCVWMDRVVARGAMAFMRDAFRGGLRARVLTSGELRADRADEGRS